MSDLLRSQNRASQRPITISKSPSLNLDIYLQSLNSTQTAPNLANCNIGYKTHACNITHSNLVSNLLRSQSQLEWSHSNRASLRPTKLPSLRVSRSIPTLLHSNCTKTLSIARTDRCPTDACYIIHSSLVSDLLRSQIETRLGGMATLTLMWSFVKCSTSWQSSAATA